MARPSKLQRFADMQDYPHVFEPDKLQVLHQDYEMKGQWGAGFFKNKHPLTLELGCGRGEYTVGLAERFPDRNFIGMDIKGARMWKGATYSIQQEIRNVAFVRTRIEFVDRIFSPGEIREIWITFPDPQPKKAKRRLIHPSFLNKYQNILAPGGKIHLKTDSRLLYEYLQAVLLESGVTPDRSSSDIYAEPVDSVATDVQTRYEKLFLDEGKSITYTCFTGNLTDSFKEPLNFDEKQWS